MENAPGIVPGALFEVLWKSFSSFQGIIGPFTGKKLIQILLKLKFLIIPLTAYILIILR